MGANNGTVEKLTRPSRTGGYSPHVWVGSRLGMVLDGRPRFTWLEAERMRLDPQVQFGLRILRAPLFGVTWKVNADSEKVSRWVDREVSRVYRKLLPKLCRHLEYGVACGEVTYQARRLPGGKTRVHFHDFGEFHPRDCRPLVYDRGCRGGRLAGMRVNNVRQSGAGSVLLDRRHSFWFKGESEYGDWWGRPRLAGAYEPWLEKRGRHGAIDSRRLFYKKGAFKGPAMRHPPGVTDLGTDDAPRLVSNQDIAREIAEKFENGGVLALPGTRDEKGEFLWSWEDPKSFSDVAGLLDYPKQLDREILIGLGIPPELVDAATVGSGYSGRAIPAQVFFCSMDEVAGLILDAIVEQIIRPLVRINFGRVGFEVVPDSLAQLVARDPAQAGQQPGGGQPQAGPGGGGGGAVPYQGKRGGTGVLDPSTGKVRYGAKPKPKVRLSLTARKKLRAARRERVRLSWTRYQGPKGGTGWVSDTGEVRYQEHPPADESARGPESVFDHPDFAHVPGPPQEPDYAATRNKYHAKAEAAGLDPAAVHRHAAELLHHRMSSHVEYGTFGKPEVQAERAARAARGYPDSNALADLRQRVAFHHAAYAKLKDSPGVNHEAWSRTLAGWDKHLADVEEGHAKGQALLAEAQEWLSGGRKIPAADRGRLLAEVYANAHDNLAREKADKEKAAAFADAYFAHDNPLRRAAVYLKALKADDGLDVSHLDADTREKIAEDLAELPPAKLAAHLAYAADQYGVDDSPVWDMARKAAGGKPAAAKPVKFDGGEADRGDLYVVTEDDVNGDRWAGLLAAAKILPGAAVMADGAVVIKAGSPLDRIHQDQHDGDGNNLEDDDGLRPLFERLTDAHHLPQSDVPASAKDFGTTSGALAPDKVADEHWDPNAVDVYKRVDKGGEWYLMKRGVGNPEAGEKGVYGLVHRKDVPPLSRLPDAYWANFDAAAEPDDDLVERTETRQQKASTEGVKEKKDVKEYRAAIDHHRKLLNQHRQAWHQALKGVPEADRPDEPDWNGVDDSALRESYGSREEHRDALEALNDDYWRHTDDLAAEVEAAKEHAAEYHRNTAAHREAIENHKAAWRAADAKIKRHVETVRAAKAVVDEDEDLEADLDNDIASHGLTTVNDDGPGDGRAAVEAVQEALDAFGKIDGPDHDYGPDPDEYDLSEEDELPADGHDSLEDHAEHHAAAADDHDARLAELEKAVPEYRESVLTESAAYRKRAAAYLQGVRAAIAKALALPADRFTDSDGDGQYVHDDLTELNKKVMAALARVSKKVTLSLGSAGCDPAADARRLWGRCGGPVFAEADAVRLSLGNGPPGPPPRPGLEWHAETHRWWHPDTGEQFDHRGRPKAKAPPVAALVGKVVDRAVRTTRDAASSQVIRHLGRAGRWLVNQTRKAYAKLEKRYGRAGAVAIAASSQVLSWGAFIGGPALVGVPLYIPSAVAAAPGAAIAEVVKWAKGRPAAPAETAAIASAEVDAAAKEFAAGVESAWKTVAPAARA